MLTQKDEKIYYYVLYVTAGKEEDICRIISNCLCNDIYEPFTFKKITSFKRGKVIRRVTRVIFPGYVFIKTCLTESDFFIKMICFVRNTNHIIRILNYGSNEKLAVEDDEIAFLLDLCNEKYCIEYSKGFIEGDKITVVEGPLMGQESKIRKINKQKRNATIELIFMNEIRSVTIGLDCIKKAD
jgi:transcriptional antiterminator NusG